MTLVIRVLPLLQKTERESPLTLGQSLTVHKGLSHSFFDPTLDQPWKVGITCPFLRWGVRDSETECTARTVPAEPQQDLVPV